MPDDQESKLADEWFERKSSIMESILGTEHDSVMHAIIPYAVGGPLDLFYYPNGIPGTAIATKELSELPGTGPCNDSFETYELVMFTRESLALDEALDVSTPFGRAHQSISAVLNQLAPYVSDATLNSHDTCEFPADADPLIRGRYMIFDAYRADKARSEFGLLAIIEIHGSEMAYARRHGGEKLIEKLKRAGHYPYSGIDRPAVA